MLCEPEGTNPVALTWIELLGVQLLAALLATGSRARRGLALVVALPNLFVAWQLPAEHTLLRAVVALAGSFGYLRLIDLVVARGEVPWRTRLWHAAALVETSRLRYERPALDVRALGRALVYGALTLGAAWVAFRAAPALAGVGRPLARLGGGLVFMYALTDAGYASITVLFRALGIVVYDLHRAPILSRTIQEFWGERWARTVSMWLFTRTFRPLARRGRPRLGLAAAFAVSSLLHAWIILPALGWCAAALWGVYFLLQGGFVVLERALGVGRWSPALAHAWVAVVMVGTSPLMVDPTLRAFAGG